MMEGIQEVTTDFSGYVKRWYETQNLLRGKIHIPYLLYNWDVFLNTHPFLEIFFSKKHISEKFTLQFRLPRPSMYGKFTYI